MVDINAISLVYTIVGENILPVFFILFEIKGWGVNLQSRLKPLLPVVARQARNLVSCGMVTALRLLLVCTHSWKWRKNNVCPRSEWRRVGRSWVRTLLPRHFGLPLSYCRVVPAPLHSLVMRFCLVRSHVGGPSSSASCCRRARTPLSSVVYPLLPCLWIRTCQNSDFIVL